MMTIKFDDCQKYTKKTLTMGHLNKCNYLSKNLGGVGEEVNEGEYIFFVGAILSPAYTNHSY